MTVDYWSSSQYNVWTADKNYAFLKENIDENSDIYVPKDQVVYTINAIDSLADQLPKFVRHAHLHYTAMVLAQRFLTKEDQTVLDGQACCEIACLALNVAIESDGRSVPASVWDAAVMKVFPCEVVHRGIMSAVDSGKASFVQALNFDLFVYHPFETVALLLASNNQQAISSTAYGILNSLYRTAVVVENPPYVVAIASVVGAHLLCGTEHSKVGEFLSSQPVDPKLIENILTDHLYNFVKHREIPLSNPPEIENLPSPSARTGRSVSRQSSRVPSTRQTASSNKRKRGKPANEESWLGSLAWALLPPLDENRPTANDSGGIKRPVCLSELRILRETTRMRPPRGLISLSDVRLYSPAEEGIYRPHGSPFVVQGIFDANGSQFDSIVRLLRDYDSLVDVAEQLLSALLFLNELKIVHFGIEPQNIMVTSDGVKIASLATASVAPTIPSHPPSVYYQAPELLMGSTGGVKDDPHAVDLWSLGCVLAEITRIYHTRNRYEDPLFKLADNLPDKPKERFPVHDSVVYSNCRYLIRIAERLNKASVPTKDIWPDMHKRGNYQAFSNLLQYKVSHYPEKKGSLGDDVRAYMQDTPDGVMTEIVMALLRWCPQRRVSPRVCLNRVIKFRVK
jgi:hypothetical protein